VRQSILDTNNVTVILLFISAIYCCLILNLLLFRARPEDVQYNQEMIAPIIVAKAIELGQTLDEVVNDQSKENPRHVTKQPSSSNVLASASLSTTQSFWIPLEDPTWWHGKPAVTHKNTALVDGKSKD